MDKFWAAVIEPLLDAADASTVVEVGVNRGETTELLLARARRLGRGLVHAIDPAPDLDVARWQREHGTLLHFHQERSHSALERIGAVDAALIDGDHNWFTVHGELCLLAEAAATRSVPLPLIMVHDVGWPYGRRDMYYDPGAVPEGERHRAAKEGVLLGSSELSRDGINPWLWNATHYGGQRNGVLTAVEDFVSSHDPPPELIVIEGFFGLGVVVSAARREASPELGQALARLRSPEFARRWARKLEHARIEAEIRAWSALGQPAPEGGS